MNDVYIGNGELQGKGVYAARNFKQGEVVIQYELTPLTLSEYKALAESEQMFTHTVNGQILLYPEPARYVNHTETPNVYNDHVKSADIALRDITAGELITVYSVDDDVPVLKKVNAVLVKVPNIEEALDFYRMQLGQITLWKKPTIAAVKLGDSQLVMSTELDPETNILVDSLPDAIDLFTKSGGKLVSGPEDIEVGLLAVVQDPFGNQLTLLDFSKGEYEIDESKNVIGISDA